MSEHDRRDVLRWLDLARQAVSRKLAVTKDHLRANIFWPDEKEILRIPTGLHVNMTEKKELTIRIKNGTGAVGRTFAFRTPALAVFKSNWGDHTIEDEELKKVHKDLRWIISMPIPDPVEDYGVLGVLNVDCLKTEKREEELRTALDSVGHCARQLGQAFREVS